jgi:hypothetical protein
MPGSPGGWGSGWGTADGAAEVVNGAEERATQEAEEWPWELHSEAHSGEAARLRGFKEEGSRSRDADWSWRDNDAAEPTMMFFQAFSGTLCAPRSEASRRNPESARVEAQRGVGGDLLLPSSLGALPASVSTKVLNSFALTSAGRGGSCANVCLPLVDGRQASSDENSPGLTRPHGTADALSLSPCSAALSLCFNANFTICASERTSH